MPNGTEFSAHTHNHTLHWPLKNRLATAVTLRRRRCLSSSSFLLFLFLPSCAAEIKKQRDFYQKLGMEVPGDIKGELCNMKTHLDQRNGTLSPHGWKWK